VVISAGMKVSDKAMVGFDIRMGSSLKPVDTANRRKKGHSGEP
jgi:hypothetical protein